MFFRGSELPPRNLIALIASITVLPLITLLWLGWRLIEQDRVLEGQQAQQRVERAADLLVAALQRALSASSQQLAAGAEDWASGAVSVIFRDGAAEAHPKHRAAYLPVAPALPDAGSRLFVAGEELEFLKHDPVAALRVYGEHATSPKAAIRAGALLRLGRNLASVGRTREALQAYGQLSGMNHVSIGGTPAGLIGRYARCELLQKEKRASELYAEAERLAVELHSGRWTLTGPLYWLYAGDARRWTGSGPAKLHQAEIFAEAIGTLWEKWRSMPATGHETVAIGGQNLTILWQHAGASFRALIAAPEFVERQWLAAAAPVAGEQRVSILLADVPGTNDRPTAKRKSGNAALPWNIVVTSLDPPGQDGDFALRQRLLIAGLVVLVFMALAASYLIFRAVSRELAVARLQSDFVAAVSHEFRTPLTALRQFTDMLRENATLSDDRRRLCYDAQSRATDRLMRLVESLLDFGRMEARAHRYQFEQRDCTELVQRTVEEFRADAQAVGYRIEFSGNASAQIDTDGEALARAVRNLLENAVKYSPGHRRVEVGLNRRDESVRIEVRDYGIGIPAHEKATIFAKFQRGEQARKRGIKGTGIGLAMVDEIVKAHHGTVEVESASGKGSTFTIVLPAKG